MRMQGQPLAATNRVSAPARAIAFSLLAVLAVTGSGTPVQAAAAASPIVTNKSRFHIPYRFDPAVLQRLQARELQLFVSPDGGRRWQFVQSIAPQEGRFEFQAPGDGEYWFSVKTLDARGRLHPEGTAHQPGLVVQVDSLEPRLDLVLSATGDNRVELSWTATDDHLDASTLKLEYLLPNMTDWQTVAITARETGQVSWTLSSTGIVAVRGQISDSAGNVGRAQHQVTVGGAPAPRPRPAAPSVREPIAESLEPQELAQDTMPRLETVPQRVPMTAEPKPDHEPAISPGPSIGQFVSDGADTRPSIMNRWDPAPDELSTTRPTTSSGYQPDPGMRYVGRRQFDVAYQIEDVGPSGIGSVEFFVTENGGREWWKYGEDPDRASPMTVQVPQDGVYGFAIRVRSGAGISVDAPKSGDRPDLQITVDQTAPKLELLPIQQGSGTGANQIAIRWRLEDDHLGATPVTLHHANNPEGPWTRFAEANSQADFFRWTIPSHLPSRIYIRVEATDLAGNVTLAELPEPVVVDLSKPHARILDVAVPQYTSPR